MVEQKCKNNISGRKSSLSKENFVLPPDLSLQPTTFQSYIGMEVDDYGNQQ
jgi:hypothetical protein